MSSTSDPTADSPSASTQLHQGYDFESSLLVRFRSWVDLFGWVRLGRVLRLSGSPILVACCAVTTLVWLAGWNWISGEGSLFLLSPTAHRATVAPLWQQPFWFAASPWDLASSLSTFSGGTFSRWPETSPVPGTNRSLGFLGWLLRWIWSIVVWCPAALILSRQGALATAGRHLVSLGDVMTWTRRRFARACFAAVIPSLCAVTLALPLWGLLAIVGSVSSPWLVYPISVVLVLGAIPVGMLAFGSFTAIPLAWAAIANERDPDPMDALSRGFEYLFRRPLRLMGYAVISFITLVAITALALAVVTCAREFLFLLSGVPQWRSTSGELTSQSVQSVWSVTGSILASFPVIIAFTVFWGLVGGVYLLLRQDAGGQEVEDLWIEAAHPEPPLPALKP